MGEVFAGRYELVDPVGRGGVGAVWRAWDHRRRRYVAAKVLRQRDAYALLRFVREQAMRIDHPHVLAPASWAADDDQVLFTMDLVHGGSLSHLIGDYGPLPPRLVCVLLDQLLAGLAAVHAEGIVHRDVKPANVLLEATGTGTPHVRLSDFGIAMRKGEPRLTEADFVVGTPGYFAPEQLLGAEPDFAADLYAVGLVALYLLSGRKPDAQALVERFEATAGMPTAPLGVPEPLWQVVGALLQPDPDARFRTATGTRKALATALPLLPEPAPDEEPVEIFDQIGPLPEGFGPTGPVRADADPRSAERERTGAAREVGPQTGAGSQVRGPRTGAAEAASPAPDPRVAPPRTPDPGTPDPGTSYPASGSREPTARPVDAPAAWPPEPAPRAESPSGPAAMPESRPQAAPAPPQPQPGEAWPPETWPPRPRGRHAAPLAAYEPLAHTRTRTGRPAAAPLPAAPGGYDPSVTAPITATVPVTAAHPGPPARVALTLLVLAALCFAVGIAALIAS